MDKERGANIMETADYLLLCVGHLRAVAWQVVDKVEAGSSLEPSEAGQVEEHAWSAISHISQLRDLLLGEVQWPKA